MTTYSLSYTQGSKLAQLQLACPIGERLTLGVTALTTAGAARDCTGGTLTFAWLRRAAGSMNPTGAPLKVTAAGDATGKFLLEVSELTTRYLDGTYSCDVWYTPVTGSPEQVLSVGTIQFGPVVGSTGDQTIDVTLESAINDAVAGSARIFATCASVRDNADHVDTPYVLVLGRGLFAWTASAGTDSEDEATDYIAGTGGGFAIDPTCKRGGTTAERPAYPGLGQTYYDTTISALVAFDGTSWTTV